VDAADQLSSRPDFAIAAYPGHLWLHEDDDRPTRDETDLRLRPDIHPTADTPPTFLVMAEDDHVDGVQQALAYYVALQSAGVPTEMHLYAQGGHAFGLRKAKLPIGQWPQLVETWLHTIGMLPRRALGGGASDAIRLRYPSARLGRVLDETTLVQRVSDRLIERMGLGAMITARDLHPHRSRGPRPLLRCRHKRPAHACSTSLGANRKRRDATEQAGRMKERKKMHADYAEQPRAALARSDEHGVRGAANE
jgi:hypothetical protein